MIQPHVIYGMHCCDPSADTADLEASTEDLETDALEVDTADIVAVREERSPPPAPARTRSTAGIDADEAAILDLLRECTGGLTIPDICDELDRSKTWIQKRLASLYGRRLVRRVADKTELPSTGGRHPFLWFIT